MPKNTACDDLPQGRTPKNETTNVRIANVLSLGLGPFKLLAGEVACAVTNIYDDGVPTDVVNEPVDLAFWKIMRTQCGENSPGDLGLDPAPNASHEAKMH